MSNLPMKPLIISLAVNGRENYINMQKGLARTLPDTFDKWILNAYTEGVTPHSEMPYKFKFDLIKQAREEGYKKVFWLDSTMRLVRDKNITDLLDAHNGIMAFDNLGHALYKYISDDAASELLVMEDQIKKIPHCWGGAIGFDFSLWKACRVFDEIYHHSTLRSFKDGTSTREGFISHRHDQAVMSVIFWRHKYSLIPYGKIVNAIHSKPPFEYGKDFYIIYGD